MIKYKDTNGKPKMRFIPYIAKEQIAYTREYGNRKYGSDLGWQTVTVDDWLDAIERHIGKYRSGEVFDGESGMAHLAHIATGAVLALAVEKPENLRTLIEADNAIEDRDKEIDAMIVAQIQSAVCEFKYKGKKSCIDQCLIDKANEIWSATDGDTCVS